MAPTSLLDKLKHQFTHDTNSTFVRYNSTSSPHPNSQVSPPTTTWIPNLIAGTVIISLIVLVALVGLMRKRTSKRRRTRANEAVAEWLNDAASNPTLDSFSDPDLPRTWVVDSRLADGAEVRAQAYHPTGRRTILSHPERAVVRDVRVKGPPPPPCKHFRHIFSLGPRGL